MHISVNAVRPLRRKIMGQVRNGHLPLRVVGDQKSGYRLGGERGETIILFSRIFAKQGEAKTAGLVKFKKMAKAVVKKVA